MIVPTTNGKEMKKDGGVDDDVCTDGGTVLGFSMLPNRSRTIILVVSGT
jgi:hypothetical protein